MPVKLSDPISEDPFIKLMEQVQAAVEVGRSIYEPDKGSESQAIAWCVVQALRKAGYVVSHEGTGFQYPAPPAT